MFEYVRGELAAKSPTEAILDVGGVGYRLYISLNTSATMPDSGVVRLLVHPHYAEGDQRLFGFADERERTLFRLLQGVKGVGPALAMTILSHEPPEGLLARIRDNDLSGLVRIKGIGRKTAERLLVELRDRLPAEPTTSESVPSMEAMVAQALTHLGLTPAEAHERARSVVEAHPGEQRVETLLRSALQQRQSAAHS